MPEDRHEVLAAAEFETVQSKPIRVKDFLLEVHRLIEWPIPAADGGAQT